MRYVYVQDRLIFSIIVWDITSDKNFYKFLIHSVFILLLIRYVKFIKIIYIIKLLNISSCSMIKSVNIFIKRFCTISEL